MRLQSPSVFAKRLKFSGLLICALLITCNQDTFAAQITSTTDDAETVHPNIVVVLVDDLRWDEIGTAGHPYINTPNIDQVARSGVSFRNAFTTTPLCSPSRASFLTGQYAHKHGIVDNLGRDIQTHRLDTFPRKLDAAGYDTAFIGKWHMGNDDSPRPGFDFSAIMRGQGEAIDPQFNINGERKTIGGYVTDILTQMAVDFIEKPRAEPFLLYISHKALHPNVTQLDDGSTTAPPSGRRGFISADRHEGMYSEVTQPRRRNFGIRPTDKPALMRQIDDMPPLGPDTVTPDRTIQERQEMLMAVDDGLGMILKALQDTSTLDDTIVVFTSDHGYWYGEHGLSGERRLAYEEAIRIPMLVSYPRRISAGTESSRIVLSIDLAPTLLEYAGVQLEDEENEMHGRSLVPLLEGHQEEWRSSFLIEYYSDTVYDRIRQMGYRAVRTDSFKYIQYTALQDMDELYDLRTDPYELNNIISDPGARPVLRDMQVELQKLLYEHR